MNWELVLSIIGAATGGGCLIYIFAAGAWKGTVNAKLAEFDKTLENQPNAVDNMIQNKISEVSHMLRSEFQTLLTRVHERIDNSPSSKDTQQDHTQLQSLISGLAAQRQEWDTLRSDVRSLLRSEATTVNEISNFKERLSIFEQKLGATSEKIIRLESDVGHIDSNKRK